MATNEEAEAPASQADEARARFEAEAKAIREEAAAGDEAESPVRDALSELGIDYEARPKEDAPKPAPAAEEPAEAPSDENLGTEGQPAEDSPADGLDSLVEAMQPQDKRQDAASAIEREAAELGLSESYGRWLAHNAPRKEARKVLDAERARVQSAPVAQSAPSAEAPPTGLAASAGQAPDAPAEVAETLRSVLDDETAEAVTKALSPLMARLEQQEQALQGVAQFTQAQQAESLRSQVRTVAGELAGEFPQLVRGQDVDPAVGRVAADLIRGSYAGDLKGALRTAAQAVYGSVSTGARQDSTATPGPDTAAPPATPASARSKPYSGDEMATTIGAINRKFANDPARATAEVARVTKMFRQHNARFR